MDLFPTMYIKLAPDERVYACMVIFGYIFNVYECIGIPIEACLHSLALSTLSSSRLHFRFTARTRAFTFLVLL